MPSVTGVDGISVLGALPVITLGVRVLGETSDANCIPNPEGFQLWSQEEPLRHRRSRLSSRGPGAAKRALVQSLAESRHL